MDAAKFQKEMLESAENQLKDNLANIPGFPVDDPIIMEKTMEISRKATLHAMARIFEVCSDEELSLLEESYRMHNSPKMRAISKKTMPILISSQQEVMQKMMDMFGF